jgi:NADPH:quinone reductase-like Zn-dependent oxidoreductase
VGDEVFGVAPGSVAEYARAREDKLARRPANLTWEQAATAPISGGTALQAVVDAGAVAAGQKVLVTGASGGVGSYAVQLAKAFGAEVTGVASASKADLVRELGADHVLDYASDDFADGSQRYDLIIDIAGLSRLVRLRRALTPTGTLVLVGGEGGGDWTGGTIGRQLRAHLASLLSSQRLTSVIAKERASDYERLAVFLASGQVVPSVDRAYPLAEAADAVRHLESGKVRAKLAITVGPGR